MSRMTDRLKNACHSVREVAATAMNAQRLHQLYKSAHLTDSALVAATKEVDKPVQGMTETITVEGIFELLSTHNTLALEIPDPEDDLGAPLAFVINHFSGKSTEDKRHFRQFMMTAIWNEDQLCFFCDDDRARLDKVFDEGQVLYFGECVSIASQAMTTALIFATYQRLVCKLFVPNKTIILGKCLESIRIGDAINDKGNSRIKKIAESIGLRLIGNQTYQRFVSTFDCLQRSATGRSEIDDPTTLKAELCFGFYLGSTNLLKSRLARLGLIG